MLAVVERQARRRSCRTFRPSAESGLPDYVYEFLVRRDGAGRHAAGDPQQGQRPTSRAVLKLPDVAKTINNQGLVVVTQSPAEFDKLIASEAERYGKILRDAGVGTPNKFRLYA